MRALAPAAALCVALSLGGCSLLEWEEGGSASGTAVDGWTIAVSVEPATVGPLVVSVGAVRAAPRTDSSPWVQHELVFENTGDRPLRFADTRLSRWVGSPGERRLIAADQGCGYTPQTRRERIKPGACLLYLDELTVEPHSAVTRTVTLFKDLRGMRRLVPGTYVFEKPIRFRAGRTAPPEGSGREVTLRILYEIERS